MIPNCPCWFDDAVLEKATQSSRPPATEWKTGTFGDLSKICSETLSVQEQVLGDLNIAPLAEWEFWKMRHLL
jgi:hypothetical protein